MNLIIDASIAIKWFIPENHWEHAARLQSQPDMYAPDFMLLECNSILTKKVRRNELGLEISNQIQESLLAVPIQLVPWQNLLQAATLTAHATYRSVYDCLYMVLARQLEGKMVTADLKLYRSLEDHPEWANYLLWIEDVSHALEYKVKSSENK